MDVFLAWYVLIITGGVIVGRRFGRLASLAVMIEMDQLGLLFLGAIKTGRVDPILLIPGAGILPKIGYYSGVSAGGLVPPLVFVLVAMFVRRADTEAI